MTTYNKIDKFITRLCIEEQEARGILNRDITPELDVELSNIKQNLADIIEKVLNYQSLLKPNIIEIAASGGQYFMNGIPLIFTLFQYEYQKDNKYYLKFDFETTVDEEFYGEEYHRTKKIIEILNKHYYCSYDVEQLNKIVSHYTYDYADFEYNEEDNEWHGNIY